jgi:hypothetical protein
MEDKHAKELRLKQERELRASDEKDRKEMEAQRLVLQVRAAAIIQAYWRGFALRRALKGGKKGGKGGKGAKGKKK